MTLILRIHNDTTARIYVNGMVSEPITVLTGSDRVVHWLRIWGKVIRVRISIGQDAFKLHDLSEQNEQDGTYTVQISRLSIQELCEVDQFSFKYFKSLVHNPPTKGS